MNRAELIDALAERMEMTRREAGDVVTALFNPTEGVIAKALKKGDVVSLTGFGAFGVRKRSARTARNPQTGEAIKVAATKVPAFKAGASLKGVISGKTKSAAEGRVQGRHQGRGEEGRQVGEAGQGRQARSLSSWFQQYTRWGAR